MPEGKRKILCYVWHHFTTCVLVALLAISVAGMTACSSVPPMAKTTQNLRTSELLTVDCLLAPQVRQLGARITYLAPRRAVRTSGVDCAMRGGEYVAYDRADFRSALAVWLPLAQEGNSQAQTYVGEIYEKGLGTQADYETAALWYNRAASKNYSRAQINLGYLYESGLGVERDLSYALNLYRQAAGFTTAELQYVSAIEVTDRKNLADKTATLSAQVESLKQQMSQRHDTLYAQRQQIQRAESQVKILLKQLEARNSINEDNRNERYELAIEKIKQLQLQLIQQKLALTAPKQSIQIQETVVSRGSDRTKPAVPKTALRSHTGGTAPQNSNNANTDKASKVSLAGIEFGEYHALVIGNDTYQSMDSLKTATNDAISVEGILREKYGFRTVLLLNANQRTTLTALERMRATLGKHDNLVIYYAGHGTLDPGTGRGYWLPTDAAPDNKERWIANSEITAMIDSMKAKHILVVADSCYSGTLTRSSVARVLPTTDINTERKWLQAITKTRVRTVLSSGGMSPVLDGLPNSEHSLFAGMFLQALTDNTDVLKAYDLFYRLQKPVATAAASVNMQQVPQYSPIRHAGHQAGDFIFMPLIRRIAN